MVVPYPRLYFHFGVPRFWHWVHFNHVGSTPMIAMLDLSDFPRKSKNNCSKIRKRIIVFSRFFSGKSWTTFFKHFDALSTQRFAANLPPLGAGTARKGLGPVALRTGRFCRALQISWHLQHCFVVSWVTYTGTRTHTHKYMYMYKWRNTFHVVFFEGRLS